MIHRFLEDLDRARQRADLVGAIDMGNLDVLGSLGDLLDGGGDLRKRTCDRAVDDDDAKADQHQREAADAGQDKGQLLIDIGLPGDLLAALGIDLGKRLEVVVERRADRAIGVVVAPLAARGGADLDRAANQFFAEFDELFDAFLEGGELFGIVGLDDGIASS